MLTSIKLSWVVKLGFRPIFIVDSYFKTALKNIWMNYEHKNELWIPASVTRMIVTANQNIRETIDASDLLLPLVILKWVYYYIGDPILYKHNE